VTNAIARHSARKFNTKMSPAYKRYALALCSSVYMLNLVDRGAVMLLAQPIKEDLRLSDTQLGFLTGVAFGLFYAVLGVPIARWADRGNRVTITSLAIALWAMTVMSCVIVTNFLQMALARIAAGIGEAGCKPPTYSLLADYFPQPAERARAMAIYTSANYLSSLVSFIIGGWLNERYGWRLTFFLMGIPGILLAMFVKTTLVEPRARSQEGQIPLRPVPSLKAVLLTLWRQRSCRHLSIALILLYTMTLGMGPWYAAFMIRTYGMRTAELGLWLGLIFGLSGMAGALLGGHAAARWFIGNERLHTRITAVAVGLIVPFFIMFLTVSLRYIALLTLIPPMMVFGAFLGHTYALMQRLVADEMRATAMACVMLLANLVGFGIGPQCVGVISDVLQPLTGVNSLRYAMLSMSLVALAGAWQFWKVGQTIRDDLSMMRRDHPAVATRRGAQNVIGI
jgi:MFS family permease